MSILGLGFSFLFRTTKLVAEGTEVPRRGLQQTFAALKAPGGFQGDVMCMGLLLGIVLFDPRRLTWLPAPVRPSSCSGALEGGVNPLRLTLRKCPIWMDVEGLRPGTLIIKVIRKKGDAARFSDRAASLGRAGTGRRDARRWIRHGHAW